MLSSDNGGSRVIPLDKGSAIVLILDNGGSGVISAGSGSASVLIQGNGIQVMGFHMF